MRYAVMYLDGPRASLGAWVGTIGTAEADPQADFRPGILPEATDTERTWA